VEKGSKKDTMTCEHVDQDKEREKHTKSTMALIKQYPTVVRVIKLNEAFIPLLLLLFLLLLLLLRFAFAHDHPLCKSGRHHAVFHLLSTTKISYESKVHTWHEREVMA
jgi:hypothetical protein